MYLGWNLQKIVAIESITNGRGIGTILALLLLCLIILFLAKSNHYFQFPFPFSPKKIPFEYPLGAFAIYLLTALLFIPFLLSFYAKYRYGSSKWLTHLSAQDLGYLQFASIAIIFIILIGYCLLIDSRVRHAIFWGESQKKPSVFWRNLGIGAFSWFICYPLMMLVNLIVEYITLKIWGERGVDQVAVKTLSETLPYPASFLLLSIAVVIIVPFIEETLFRGFLQTWLKQYLGRWGAILLVATLFALVHFAKSQGRGNLELILSLFVLALFLGFIYERQTTLWASYGLHMTFNAVTVLILAFNASTLEEQKTSQRLESNLPVYVESPLAAETEFGINGDLLAIDK